MNHGRKEQFMNELEKLKYEEYDEEITELIDRTIDEAKWIWGWMNELDHGETAEEEYYKWKYNKLNNI